MEILRAFAIALTLIFFFLIAVPVQWLALRFRSKLAVQIPLFFCKIILYLLRVEVQIQADFKAIPGPCLLVSNHVSWIDILVHLSASPIAFLAKREIASWPLISAFAKLQDTIFVDRKRRRSIPGANADMAAKMLKARKVLLFPEGTTADGVELLKFHSSHFAAARDLLVSASHIETVIVQPVAVFYSASHAAWVGDAALLPHVMDLLRREPLVCQLIYGAPLVYARGTNRKHIALEARASIAGMLTAARQNKRAPAPDSFAEITAQNDVVTP
jgi:1-acyl-sn-glycerol-3-phosphate acyltransferase